MTRAEEVLVYLKEANKDKSYFNIDHLSRFDIEKFKKELTKSGLKLGSDYFVKSGQDCWILNSKYDTAQVDILNKYGAEET